MSTSVKPRRSPHRLTPLAHSIHLASLGLLCAGSALAQTAAPSPNAPAVMPEVRAKAQAPAETATGPVNGYAAGRSATGTKTDTPLIEVPQSISVIGRDEMESRGTQTLLEAVRYTPGVAVSNWGYDVRGYDWLLIRGFDAQSTSNFRDGLRQAGGPVYLDTLTEPYGLERVEVLRGPSSVLFGKGDAGGVVNRVSKTPSLDAPREVEVQLGSHQRKQLAADVGGALNSEGTLLYRIVGVGLDTNSQEQYPNGADVYAERAYLAPSLRWQITPQTSLTVLAEVLRNKASDDVGYVADAEGNITNVKEGDPDFSRIKIGSTSLGYQLEHRFSSDWALRQNFRFANRTSEKHHMQRVSVTGDTLSRTAVFDDEEMDQTTLDTNVQGRVTTGGLEHTLLFGVDWDEAKGDWSRWTTPATPSLSVSAPDYGLAIAKPDVQTAQSSLRTRQLGFYAQDQLRFDPRWLLTLGVRHDRVKLDAQDRLAGTSAEQNDDATTGRVGLTYLAPNGMAPYIGISQSFLPTNVSDFGTDGDGQPFKPSRAHQVEVGVKIGPANGDWLFTAAVFQLTKNNVVTFDDTDFTPRQIGRIRSRGLEFEAKGRLAPGLQGTAAYSYTDVEVLESNSASEVGKTPIQVPKHLASLWLDYTPAAFSGFGFGAGVRYVGRRYNDAANTSSEDGYALAEAAVYYDQGPWRVALNVNNLFDKEYYASRANGAYQIGEERSVLLSAKYRF